MSICRLEVHDRCNNVGRAWERGYNESLKIGLKVDTTNE
jgi:hypothetical protein